MTVVFGVFLLSLLLATAIGIVRAKNLFVAVMMSGIFSLLMAANFFILDAADVALTEAAVGAGISTVLFLGALSLTADRERTRSGGALAPLVVVAATALIVIYATFDKPRFGDPAAPVHTHVVPWYFERTADEIDIPNVVTAILGSFRGYDTLGEVFVVFTAGIGVLFLLGVAPPSSEEAKQRQAQVEGLRHYLIPRTIGRLLIPFILLFGLYVQFHGEYGPGGGFQAGAIFAAAMVLYALLEGEGRALEVWPMRTLVALAVVGPLLFGMVGVVTMLLGGNFLEYGVLSENSVSGQQVGILVIEAGVGLTVASILLAIYHAFAARD